MEKLAMDNRKSAEDRSPPRNFAALARANDPPAAIVDRFAKPFPLVVEFTISPVPWSVMLAASVTIFAPAKFNFPPLCTCRPAASFH